MGINITHGGKGQAGSTPVPRTKPSRPFRLPKTPFDPQTGKYLPLVDDTNIIEVFTVVEEYNDYLSCTNVGGGVVNVAKPYMLRRSSFDGKTVDGVSYSYTAANARTASADGEDDESQVITPDYFEDEKIIAVRHSTGVYGANSEIKWEDLNTAGRCWAMELDDE